MSNTKKILLVIVLIIICAVLIKLIFDLSNKYSIDKLTTNIVPNAEQTANALPNGGTVTTTNNLDNTNTEAKLIESKGLAEFDSSNDKWKPEIMGTILKSIDMVNEINKVWSISSDDWTDKNKLQESLTVLNTQINKYPEESYFYISRVWYSLKLGKTNYSEMNSDLDIATKYMQQNDNGMIQPENYKAPTFNSTISLLRAKISALSGDGKELDYLIDSVKSRSRETKGDISLSGYFVLFYQNRDTKTDLTLSDFNSLIQSYPNDYRSYLLRGIYYGGNPDSSNDYVSLAINDFNKAIKLNPKSTDAYYFMGKLYSEKIPESINKNAVATKKYLDQVVSIDPSYTYAYLTLGIANTMLENNIEAIKNYGKVIELDKNNVNAYKLRSEIEDYSNKFDPYGNQVLTEKNTFQEGLAISDITKAIEIQEGSPFYSYYRYNIFNLYEERAGYYFKIRDASNTVRDYNKVVGALLAKQIILMDIKTIRSIYPEFSDISDKDLLEGLRQKYYPFFYSQEEFYDLIMSNKKDMRDVRSKDGGEDYMNQYILSYYYLQQGEAYYNSGDTYKALIEYKRMIHNCPEYPIDKVRLSRINGTQ